MPTYPKTMPTYPEDTDHPIILETIQQLQEKYQISIQQSHLINSYWITHNNKTLYKLTLTNQNPPTIEIFIDPIISNKLHYYYTINIHDPTQFPHQLYHITKKCITNNT